MKTINLNEQTRITDPCYSKDVSFTAVIPTLSGEYRVVGLNTYEILHRMYNYCAAR